MGFFSWRCPVGDDAGAWTERSMGWLREQFGDDPLGSEIVLPTVDHIPGDYTGGHEVAYDLLDLLCEHLSVDPTVVTLEVTILAESGDVAEFRENVDVHYRRDNGRQIIEIHPDLLTQPVKLVARIAHGLGHTRLLGEERITADQRDHEQLADLLTIYFGLGIFTANASYDSHHVGRYRTMSRIGYLPEPMFGYGLACYAWLRDEPWPSWSDYLDHGPRSSLKAGLDYLEHVAEPGQLPRDLDDDSVAR